MSRFLLTMGDYNPIDDYAWPDDLFDDTGQIDQDRLMEILEANPELMELLQRGSVISQALPIKSLDVIA